MNTNASRPEPPGPDLAAAIVRNFADAHGWHAAVAEPLFASVEILPTQDRLWQRIKTLEGLDADAPLPTSGLSAAIVDGILLLVPPAAFAQIRPEYAPTADAWTRLIAHELAHVLHARVVGDEERMGPRWFYEGFAMLVAGQDFAAAATVNSAAPALAATRGEGRGAYARYGAAVRYLADQFGIEDLVDWASREDFEARLTGNGVAEA